MLYSRTEHEHLMAKTKRNLCMLSPWSLFSALWMHFLLKQVGWQCFMKWKIVAVIFAKGTSVYFKYFCICDSINLFTLGIEYQFFFTLLTIFISIFVRKVWFIYFNFCPESVVLSKKNVSSNLYFLSPSCLKIF